MSETKWTPGPWAVDVDRRCGGYCITAPNGRDVASSVQRDEHPTLGQGISDTQALTNARLIAAAPDMIEALIEAVDCGMVPISSIADGGATRHSRQVRCADAIRAALAKARGES